MGLQVTCSGHYKKGGKVVWLQEGRVQGTVMDWASLGSS